jgi:hypothetical protein
MRKYIQKCPPRIKVITFSGEKREHQKCPKYDPP